MHFVLARGEMRGQDRAMPAASAHQDIRICKWAEISDKERLAPAVDAIFFESSSTKSFADAEARDAFRARWLGRYLKHDPQWVYLALAGDAVAGYLAGRVDDPEPTRAGEDIARFAGAAQLAAEYPAHLHINLAPAYRSRGIGAQLIAAFAEDAARVGACGIHVVTGAASRNVGFYKHNGFSELQRASLNGREIVLLGRRLGARETA